MSKKSFALPKERAYPIEDKAHARNALARVSQHGTPAQKAEVRSKVSAKFPAIQQTTTAGRELERRLSKKDK